jgi:short subunit dehydrogenase-like uncharacterized protein
MNRKFDVIICGSTGFTGRLVCEYLSKLDSPIRWAIAGRNVEKMQKLHLELNLDQSVIILKSDIENADSIDSVTSQTKVLLSTAGPFAKIGLLLFLFSFTLHFFILYANKRNSDH